MSELRKVVFKRSFSYTAECGTDIHAFINKDQQSGHYVRIQGEKSNSFQVTIGWVEDGKDTMNVQIRVEGMRRVQRIGGSLVFTTDKEDEGASLLYS